MNNKKRSRPESSTSSTSINHPTKSTRYIDEFIRLDCAPLLLELKIFPDSKEITEAMSTFHAYRRFIQPNIPKVSLGRKCVVCVGDGSTPRCASIFALRCKGWEAIAIDPQMHLTKPTKKKGTKKQRKLKKKKLSNASNDEAAAVATNQTALKGKEEELCWNEIDRLIPVRANVEDVVVKCDIAILVLMHCHVDLDVALACIDATRGVLAMVTCPCCNWLDRHSLCFGRIPDAKYLDYGILSDKREIRVWVNDLSSSKSSSKSTPGSPSTTSTTTRLHPYSNCHVYKYTAVVLPDINDFPECMMVPEKKKSSSSSATTTTAAASSKSKEKSRDGEGLARVLALRSTMSHLKTPSIKSVSVAEAQQVLISRVVGKVECPYHCVAGVNTILPLLKNETGAQHNVRQVSYVYNQKLQGDVSNIIQFHGTVVRKRIFSSISFFSIMPAGSTKGDGKRAQKQWSESAQHQQLNSVHRVASSSSSTSNSKSNSKSNSTSSSTSSSMSATLKTTTTPQTSALPITLLPTSKPAVQVSISDVYIPWQEEKEKMNPALIWQKCIKVGDHVEIVGTPGRSSSGQLTIFVLDVCIVGRLGRREV